MAGNKCPICKKTELEVVGQVRGQTIYYCPRCQQEATYGGLEEIARGRLAAPARPEMKTPEQKKYIFRRLEKLYKEGKKSEVSNTLIGLGYSRAEIAEILDGWSSMQRRTYNVLKRAERRIVGEKDSEGNWKSQILQKLRTEVSPELYCKDCGRRLQTELLKDQRGSEFYRFYCPDHGLIKDDQGRPILMHAADYRALEKKRKKALKDEIEKLKGKGERPLKKYREELNIILSKKEAEKRIKEREKDLKKMEGKNCPECGTPTLEEYYDPNKHKFRFQCLKCNKIFSPEQVYKLGKASGLAPGLGWRYREAAERIQYYEKERDALREKRQKGELTREEYVNELGKIKAEIFGGEYGKEKQELKRKLKEHKIDKETYKERVDALNERAEKGDITRGKWHRNIPSRFGRVLQNYTDMQQSRIQTIFFAIAITVFGVVFAAFLRQWLFFFAFLSIALYIILPDPGDYAQDLTPGPLSWQHMNPFPRAKGKGGRYTGIAYLKSILKITAIVCFAFGFRGLGDVFNIFVIATAFAGYFMLKVTYDPEQPSEFIESLARFGVLGCWFIPFYVCYNIFGTWVLTFISLAFFAIPPLPKEGKGDLTKVLARGLSGQTAYYEMFDKMLFSVFMIVAFVGAGGIPFIPGWWGLTGLLKTTFIYFWIVTFIGGLFSPARERPITGAVMLGAATLIYGMGPGEQDIGSAILGPWWPSFHNSLTAVMEPIGGAFEQLGQTFGNTFFMLTDPVGYATQLSNGSYVNNPTGKTGAYGVEITGVDIMPIYPEQPYLITVTIKNEGAFPATDVRTNITSVLKNVAITSLGIRGSAGPPPIMCSDVTCYTAKEGTLVQQDVRQYIFEAPNGISCGTINAYDIRDKFIPFKVSVDYGYNVTSNLQIEFMSKDEWDRLALANQLQKRKVVSQISTSPVKLSIGTMEQPIRGGTPFFIGMKIDSQEANSIIENAKVYLEFPIDFGTPRCANAKVLNLKTDKTTVIWEFTGISSASVYCNFDGFSLNSSSPTRTFLIEANATYTFRKWKTAESKIEFGGTDCKGAGEGCGANFVCNEPTSNEVWASVKSNVDRNPLVTVPLVYAVMQQESNVKHCNGNQLVTSGEAYGIMQLSPATAEEVGVDYCKYNKNIEGGVEYLQKMLTKYSAYADHNEFALAAYNCGPGCVDAAMGKVEDDITWSKVRPFLPEETQDYVPKVLGYRDDYLEEGLPESKGSPYYCDSKMVFGGTLCVHGEGGCASTSECDESATADMNDDDTETHLVCRTLGSDKVCCYEDETEQQCLSAFNSWKS